MKRILSCLVCGLILLSLFCVPASAETDSSGDQVSEALLAALYEADIRELKTALDAGVLTSVELTEYYLERIEAYNKDFNCFITICDDALEVAAKRDRQRSEGTGSGLLFGIPIVIKDNMDLVGYHTTNGFKKNDNQIASDNADVVDYLLQEGAVIIAKANMSTEAQDARRSSSRAVGETKNAYSLDLAAGGSSGGSAVATSLNFAAAALGTDTNSSLRIPAALAGCVSLRPTFGSISVKGIKKLNGTRDVPGAITRSVYDQAIMLDVLSQGKHNYTQNLDEDRLVGMRIGVLKQLSYALYKTEERTEKNIDDEVEAAFENALDELRKAGAEIVEVSMPDLFTLSDKTFANNNQAPKDALYQAFEKLLEKENVQAVIYPSYLSTPLRALYDTSGTYWDPYAQLFINNCRTLSPSAGLPEISVPIGRHSLGAGIGMEIATIKNNEQLLLDIAYGYTTRFNHRDVPSGAPNLFSGAYVGDVAQVVACLQIKDAIESTVQGLSLGLTDTSGCFYTPQIPSANLSIASIVFGIIIGFVLILTALIIVAIILEKKKRKQQRRRRRKKISFE